MALTVEETHFFERKQTLQPNPDLLVTMTRFNPGEALPRHVHRDPYIGIIIAGSYSEKVSDTEDHIVEGDLVFHPALELHEDVMGSEGALIINLSIAERFWEIRGLETIKPAKRTIIRDPRFLTLANGLRATWYQQSRRTVLGVEGIALSIIDLFIEIISEDSERDTSLKAAETYIETHYHETISLDALAERLNLSSDVLSKRFKQEYGETLSERILRRRMNEAERMLLETDDSLSSIAQEVGFYDQSHFARKFSRWKGISPGKYRSFILAQAREE